MTDCLTKHPLASTLLSKPFKTIPREILFPELDEEELRLALEDCQEENLWPKLDRSKLTKCQNYMLHLAHRTGEICGRYLELKQILKLLSICSEERKDIAPLECIEIMINTYYFHANSLYEFVAKLTILIFEGRSKKYNFMKKEDLDNAIDKSNINTQIPGVLHEK